MGDCGRGLGLGRSGLSSGLSYDLLRMSLTWILPLTSCRIPRYIIISELVSFLAKNGSNKCLAGYYNMNFHVDNAKPSAWHTRDAQ